MWHWEWGSSRTWLGTHNVSQASVIPRYAMERGFSLTTAERAELKNVCAAFGGKPVIVVLNTGSVIDCGFTNGRADDIYVDALITASYLGIRGDDALCGALVGDVNLSGKTVDTYAKTLEDYPSHTSFNESRAHANYYEAT